MNVYPAPELPTIEMAAYYEGMGGLSDTATSIWNKTVATFRDLWRRFLGQRSSVTEALRDISTMRTAAAASGDRMLQAEVESLSQLGRALAVSGSKIAAQGQALIPEINRTEKERAQAERPTSDGMGFVLSGSILVAGGLVVAAGAVISAMVKWILDKRRFDDTLAGVRTGLLQSDEAAKILAAPSKAGSSLLAGFSGIGLVGALAIGAAIVLARR